MRYLIQGLKQYIIRANTYLIDAFSGMLWQGKKYFNQIV